MNPDAIETLSQRLWGLLIRWMLTAVSVWVATCMVRGVEYVDWPSLLAAAIALSEPGAPAVLASARAVLM